MFFILFKRSILFLIGLIVLRFVMIGWRFLRVYMILNELKFFINISKLIDLLFVLIFAARLISDRFNCFIISRAGLNCLTFLFVFIIVVFFCILIARSWYGFVLLRCIVILFLLLIVWWIICSLFWRFRVLLIKTLRVMITSITEIIYFLFAFLRVISIHILLIPTRSLILVQFLLFAFHTHLSTSFFFSLILFLVFLMVLFYMFNLPDVTSRIFLVWVESWKPACVINLVSSIIIAILFVYFLFVSRFLLDKMSMAIS